MEKLDIQYLLAVIFLTKNQYFRRFFTFPFTTFSPSPRKGLSFDIIFSRTPARSQLQAQSHCVEMCLTFCFPGNLALQSKTHHFLLPYSIYSHLQILQVYKSALPWALDLSLIRICHCLGKLYRIELLKYLSSDLCGLQSTMDFKSVVNRACSFCLLQGGWFQK